MSSLAWHFSPLLQISGHLLRYFTKNSPRRTASTPAGVFCSCLVSAPPICKRPDFDKPQPDDMFFLLFGSDTLSYLSFFSQPDTCRPCRSLQIHQIAVAATLPLLTPEAELNYSFSISSRVKPVPSAILSISKPKRLKAAAVSSAFWREPRDMP